MEGRILLGAVAAAVVLCAPSFARAYDDQTTHPALTAETVALHNRLFPADPVTAEERAWLLLASTDEDIVPRSLNHLYDPVHRTGWTGRRTGWVPEVVVRLASLLALVPDAPLASVEWVDADSVQEAYGRYGGNRSWSAGLRALARGDREEAHRSLGSALHLLQDAGVPDHARDDTHVHAIRFATGDDPSPFESYATRYREGNLNLASRVQAQVGTLPRYRRPAEYLEDNARFSANSFFSGNTVQDASFPLPVVGREENGIAYGQTADGREVPLARRVKRISLLAGSSSSLVLASGPEFDAVHEAHFRILAERTAVLGVGMIRDFREAEARLAPKPQASASIWSLAGEVARVVNAAADLAARASQGAGAQAARAYAWLAGSSPLVASAEPAQVARDVPREAEAVPAAQPAVRVQAPSPKPPVARAESASRAVPDAAEATPASACADGLRPQVVVSEVAWMGTQASASDEWVELVNLGPTPVSLAGWELLSGDGALRGRVARGELRPGGYGLFERTDDSSVPGLRAITVHTGALPNVPPGGYALQLVAPGCGVVDAVELATGKWPAGDAPTRRTMERVSSGSWQSSAEPGGTPGRENSGGRLPAEAAGEEKAAAKKPKKKASAPQASSAAGAVALDSGTVRISEVQLAGADAGDEWVELYNVEARPVSLAGWSLQYLPAGSSSAWQKRDFPEGAAVPAHGYFLVAREPGPAGGDGYRGPVSPDLSHRSFSLSGLGATVALVRGAERISATSSGSVADWFAYPALAPGQSFERAALAGGACLDPREGREGELLGNGCSHQEWHVRSLPEPQGAESLPEPRVAGEQPAEALEVLRTAEAGEWVLLSRELLGFAAATSTDAQVWAGYALLRGTSTPPEHVSTADQLGLGAARALALRFHACHGGEYEATFLAVPVTASSCTPGGPLSAAVRPESWEDEATWFRVAAGSALEDGEVIQLARYRYVGGAAGIQSFVLESTERLQVVPATEQELGAPREPAVAVSGLVAQATWLGAVDPGGADGLLVYEISFAPFGEPAFWEGAGVLLEASRQLEPGQYVFSVRAASARGVRGEVASTIFEVLPPALPDQLDHGQVLPQGEYPLQLPAEVALRGLGLWIVPGGGPYCCARVQVSLVTGAGDIQAVLHSSRRAVDGAGEVLFSAEGVLRLPAGEYRVQIGESPGGSNSFSLGGKLSGGVASPYLRLMVDTP